MSETVKRLRFVILWLFATCMCPALAAPTPPATLEAGALQQRGEQFRERQQSKHKVESSRVIEDPIIGKPAAEEGSGETNDGPAFKLNKVIFSPSKFISEETLAAMAAPYEGKTVAVGALRIIIKAINNYYVEHDIYTARAMLPPQDIENGVVRIQLIEGKLEAIDLSGNDHVRDGFILSRVKQAEDEVVNGAELKDDIVYFNRTSDTQIRALMRPGEQPGFTQIMLLAQEPDRYYMSPFIDNYGAKTTGRERAGLSMRMSNLIGVDDRLDGYFVGSKGERSGFLSYSLPINRRNGRIGVSYSLNDIEIVRGPFKDLDITGKSSNVALNFTQPLIATRRWMVTWAASVSEDHSETEISGVRISKNTTQRFSTGITLQKTTAQQRWALTQSVVGVRTRPENGDRERVILYKTEGVFSQSLGDSPYSLLVAAGGQHIEKAVPSEALFQIGGMGSVRGYDQGSLAGRAGYYGQLELHRDFAGRVDGYVFFDGGHVRTYTAPEDHLTSAGLGAKMSYGGHLAFDLNVGVPIKRAVADQDHYQIRFEVTGYWGR